MMILASHCGMWVPALRMKLYKSKPRVTVGVARISTLTALKVMSAKLRSKFADLSSVMVTAAR
jgi:hypothetical protein